MADVGWEVLQGVHRWSTAHPRQAVTAAHLQRITAIAAHRLTPQDLIQHLHALECHGFLETRPGAPHGQWHLTPLGRRTLLQYWAERNGSTSARRQRPVQT